MKILVGSNWWEFCYFLVEGAVEKVYVKAIHGFPLKKVAYIDPNVTAPAIYYPLGIPGEEKDIYGPCIYIKPIWTQNTEEALSSFKISKVSKKKMDELKKVDIFTIRNNQKLVAQYNPKDDAKVEGISLTEKRIRNKDGEYWSCTENIGVKNKTNKCEPEKLFLCWKWDAKDAGIA